MVGARKIESCIAWQNLLGLSSWSSMMLLTNQEVGLRRNLRQKIAGRNPDHCQVLGTVNNVGITTNIDNAQLMARNAKIVGRKPLCKKSAILEAKAKAKDNLARNCSNIGKLM